MNDNKPNRETPAEKAARLKSLVMRRLKWTEEEYGHFQYSQGLIYLETYLSGLGEINNEVSQTLQQSRIFWNWWKNHWTLRDQCFLISDRLSHESYFDIYKSMHSGKELATAIKPNSVVLEESYIDMIHQTVKEAVKS